MLKERKLNIAPAIKKQVRTRLIKRKSKPNDLLFFFVVVAIIVVVFHIIVVVVMFVIVVVVFCYGQ